MIKYDILKRKEATIVVLLTIIIFLTHILFVNRTGMPFVLDDEYGYWGNAAYFSGLDWSATVSKIPYYSYGYSLLLYPLFILFENTTTMYKAAVVINGMIISISFLLCYEVAKKIIKNCDIKIILSVSLMISMYPTYIVYSHISWNECLLMFIFWILSWCFMNINIKTSIYKFIVIGILSSYIYIVHQRTLGILIASILVISLMKTLNKITIKQFFCVIVPIIIIMTIHIKIKDNIQSTLWLNGSGIAINDYSGQLIKLNQLLNVEGLIYLGKAFIGQLFYICVATFLIACFGILEAIQNIFNINKQNKMNGNVYFYLFILISFIFTIMISSIFFINPGRIDQIVYGRYNEIILGPILLLGFAKLMKIEKLSNKRYMILILIFLIHTTITYFIIKTSGLNVKNLAIINTVSLYFMNYKLGIFIHAFVSIIFFRLIWISFQKKNIDLIIITVAVISTIYCGYGVNFISFSLANQTKCMLELLTVTDKIIEYEEDLPIYFLFENPDKFKVVQWNGKLLRDRSVSDYYQFILKDKKIIPVNLEELKLIRADNFVITTRNINIKYLKDKYDLYGGDSGSLLFKSK